MTPLTKEIEAANSVGESTAARISAAPKPAVSQVRTDAVSLEIPVRVHGSRITDVVRGVTPHTEPFEEQTTTMIVFAQGGVLKMSTAVTPGQMMVLTNLKSRQDVICRVVKVRTNPTLQAYVEIEFTHAQPGYWGVLFPSDSPELASKISAPLQNNSAAMPVRQTEATAAPPTPATKASPQTPTYVAPPRPESAFIAIGSHEEIQPSASSTSSSKLAQPGRAREQRVPEPARNNAASNVVEMPVAPSAPPNISMRELQGDTSPVSASSATVSSPREPEIEQPSVSVSEELATPETKSTFGQFGLSPGANSAAPTRDLFGASLGMSGAVAQEERPRKNWLLIVGCAAGVILAAGGWVLYFNRPAVSESSVHTPAIAQAAVPSAVQSVAPQMPQPSPTVNNNLAQSTNSSASDVSANARQNSTKVSRAVVTDHVNTPVQSPNATSQMLAGNLNAHPLSSQRSGADQNEAPALDAKLIAGSEAGSIPGIPGTSGSMSLPVIAKPEAARVGGQLSGPRLTSSVAPVYPAAAKQAGIEGDVVIHAVIDKNGSVSETQVISGPTVLRQAALTAIHQWKYTPSTLNGQTVSSETTVTLKFHR